MPTPRIIQLPIACDTLLLTLSEHHHVTHRHAEHPQQIHSLIAPFQHTHRIFILADQQQGQQALQLMQQA